MKIFHCFLFCGNENVTYLSCMTGIYKITSPSGKVYIDQSRRLKFRLNQYKNLSCSNQVYLYRSLKKYGFDNYKFEVLRYFPNDLEQKYLDSIEQIYMDAHKNAGFILLNIKGAGANGLHSEETKRKISAAHKGKSTGRVPWNKGLKTPDHIRLKQSEAAKTRTYTEESARILLAKRKARVPWNKGLKGAQTAWNKGVPFSQESRLKMSKSAKCRKK